jgi:Flp pilus assembly pilin Flp
MTLATKYFVKLHDRKARLDLKRDEEGLTMLAYALGAAVVVVPLAIAIALFGTSTVEQSQTAVNGAIDAASTP